jgi:geranylgeranyl pyrophosphate synthase/tryptophan 2,3-dioxygenase
VTSIATGVSVDSRRRKRGGGSAVAPGAADGVRRWAEAVAAARTSKALDALLDSFPAGEAVALWRAHGKAAAPPDVVDPLARAAAAIATARCGDGIAQLLLPSLVDARVGSYSYETYLALPLVLGDLGADAPPSEVASAALERVMHLLVDLLGLELAAAARDGASDLDHTPPRNQLWRRIRALAVAVTECSCGTPPPSGLEAAAARAMPPSFVALTAARLSEGCERWLERRPPEQRRRVALSLLPMSRSHDEQMFIRILQAFEALFVPLVSSLETAAAAIAAGAAGAAAEVARPLSPTLRQGSHLFRVLATMTPERFHSFRDLTVGASALQSRRYKRIEVLCSSPSEERARSEAFARFPKQEWPARPLDDAVAALPVSQERDELVRALSAFDREFRRWKRAHCAIAERMIGDLPGTGGTSGAAYLRRNVRAPLFPRLAAAGTASAAPATPSVVHTAASPPSAPEYLRAVEARLLASVSAYPGTAATAAREMIEAGGRRIRPLLAYFASPPGSSPPVAGGATVELLHIATLVHDDVLDRAPSRRGVPSAWWRYGDEAAVATGVYLLGRALHEVENLEDPEATAAFLDTCSALVHGEALQQLQRADAALSLYAYVRRCRVKTGSLFGLACFLGGGPERERLAGFGVNLGVAFQMLDDIWDCELDAGSGKEPGADLRSGTATLPLLLAARADPRVRDALRACRSDDDVLSWIRATGALEESRRHARRFIERALQCLVSTGHRDELVWFPSALLDGLASETSLASILGATETAIAAMAGAAR